MCFEVIEWPDPIFEVRDDKSERLTGGQGEDQTRNHELGGKKC